MVTRDEAAGAGNSSTVGTGGGLLDPSGAPHYGGSQDDMVWAIFKKKDELCHKRRVGNSSTVGTGGGLLDPREALHYGGFIGRHV